MPLESRKLFYGRRGAAGGGGWAELKNTMFGQRLQIKKSTFLKSLKAVPKNRNP